VNASKEHELEMEIFQLKKKTERREVKTGRDENRIAKNSNRASN
jgi:hypothetical protein